MTCIIGYIDKKNKKVLIGGDSAASSESSINIRKDKKVFKINEFVIGCTSSFRMIQLLRFSFKLPEIKTKNIYEYMCTEFIDAVRECFKNGGYLQKFKDGDEKGGTFLVGYKNYLFRIDSDFQVAENLNGIDAIGCGADFAIGSLHILLKIELNTTEKIFKALETASIFSTNVRKPFIILST